MVRRLAALAALSLLAGCALIPQRHPRYSHRAACRQALEQGWCYSDCPTKPDYCCAPKKVRCNADGLCMWEGCNGGIVFGVGR